MLREVRFAFSDSAYPLFRNFILVFSFRASSKEDWIYEELFTRVEPFTNFQVDYYGTKLFIFAFRVSSNTNTDRYLVYEFYESSLNGSIVDIFDGLGLTVRVSKHGRYIRTGGGSFKVFSTIEEMERYYERYYSDVDEEEDRYEDRYYEYEEESEEY